MSKYAENAPREIRAYIEANYGKLSPEALLQELFAHRFAAEQSAGLRAAALKNENASWLAKVADAAKRLWRSFVAALGGNRIDAKTLSALSPDEAMRRLAEGMARGQTLGNVAKGRGMRDRAAKLAARRYRSAADAAIVEATDGLDGEKVSAAIEDVISGGLVDIRGTEGEKIAMKVAAARFYEKYAKTKIPLSTGAVMYFAPDARTLARHNGDRALAWAEYAIHQVSNNKTDKNGKKYREYNREKVEIVDPNIAQIVAEDKVAIARNGNVMFYSQIDEDNFAYVVAHPTEDGNYRSDLTDVSSVYEKGKIPDKLNPLARVAAGDALGGVFTSEAANGNIIPQNGGSVKRFSSTNETRAVKGTDISVEQAEGEIRADIEASLEAASEEFGEDISLVGLRLHGSRVRGDARSDSDLDVVMEYSGDVREDDLFNFLNGDENRMTYRGLSVDVNPIRAEETGTLGEYMESDAEYDAEKRLWRSFVAALGGNRIDAKTLSALSPDEAMRRLAEGLARGQTLGRAPKGRGGDAE